ncbi:hypothetical protein ACS0TY_029176 [Phlomoides rotata]
MERQQELEWKAAQSTEISVDLVSAAERQLKFLAAVDRNRWLYEGPGLDRAIYRYNAYWLHLLAKHSESPLSEGPLVVPLDCEWVWHCHRLNPVRYKQDCEEFYGRILDNQNVVSSLEGTSKNPTEDIWRRLYPGEPYELDIERVHQDNMSGERVVVEKCTKYDLISAVHRQSPFFHQVLRPHMNDIHYIEGAVARYKGFLHLIKRNKEKDIKSFSVPTYDIDLIWHTHQLHPVSYCKDLLNIMGKILEHDDTDSDRSKGQKLDVGFSGTTRTFEEMYGRRYWRAGAMYRGSAPSPIRTTPYSGSITKKAPSSDENPKIALPNIEVFEVMLEFVGVRNLPEGHSGSLFVSFSKSQPDMIFNAKRTLKIFSESGEKQVASFQCQPTGQLLFELVSSLPSSLPLAKSSKTIATTSVSLQDFTSLDSNLTVEKWLDLVPSSNITDLNPIGLRVAISVTVPAPAPYTLHMVRSRPFSKSSCLFPQPVRVQFAKSWTRVVDEDGKLVLSLQMRVLQKTKSKKECRRRSVVGITESGETCTLAEFAESQWSIVNSPWSLKVPNAKTDDDHLLELTGPHTVRLFPGGRLDYETRRCEKHKGGHQLEHHLITAVKFSAEDPYGRAVALLDLKSSTVKVKEEWFLLPGCVLAFILGDILRKEGQNGLILGSKGVSNEEFQSPVVGDTNQAPLQKVVDVNVAAINNNVVVPIKGGGCGGGCGSGCGDAVRTVESGGCGGCGGSGGCGSMEKSGGCGGGCGGSGGCGNMAKSGGCGGGCGGSGGCGGGCGGSGGCGNVAKSGGCGGSGGCGNMAKSGGCGGCGGSGGCGSKVGNVSSEVMVPGNEIVAA